ncbi:MAG: hypothetical protein KAX49_11065 [Halanaerobiales bacterium]|nr:hypothetical protein [Halanaerobiales bacterium]
MPCSCNSPKVNSMNNSNGETINYEECLKTFTSQKDVTGFLQTLARALGVCICNGNSNGNQENAKESPELQCIIVPVLSLCQEINIFKLCSETLENVMKCTFVSLFQNRGSNLYQKVYSKYEDFFKLDPSLDLTNFIRLFERELRRLFGIFRSFKNKPKEFYQFLTSNNELEELGNCADSIEKSYQLIVAYIIKVTFLEELATQFTKTEFAFCQKFLRLETDLVILLTRLTDLSTNTAGGISGIGEALSRVGFGEPAHYFNSDDFNDLFDGLDETADVIQKLARIYRERLKIFRDAGSISICSRPQPPVLSPIADIPTVPPTVIV